MDKAIVFAILLRKHRFLSLKAMAKKLGIQPSSIQGWEDAGNPIFPRETNLSDIAEAYGIEPGELLEALETSRKARENERLIRKKVRESGGEKTEAELFRGRRVGNRYGI